MEGTWEGLGYSEKKKRAVKKDSFETYKRGDRRTI